MIAITEGDALGDILTSDVKLYALSTCGHCKRARQFLDDHKVKYDYVYVDLQEGEKRQKVIEEVKKYNPRCSFPTIVAGKEVVTGFDEAKLKAIFNK